MKMPKPQGRRVRAGKQMEKKSHITNASAMMSQQFLKRQKKKRNARHITAGSSNNASIEN